MTKTLSMVSDQTYILNTNEGFVIILTSKLITCFIDNFTLNMKLHSIMYLLNGSELVYWIFDLKGEVHSIWDLWISNLQKMKGYSKKIQSRVGRAEVLSRIQKNLDFLMRAAPACIYLPGKARTGED